jgi:hypothetical protein
MDRWGLGAAAIALALAQSVGCKSEPEVDPAVEANKKAYEAASAELQKPVALIAAYLPYLAPPDTKDKYAAKRRPDLERAAAAAADEIRHAANGARQNIDRSGAAATKDLVAALAAVSAACTEAGDPAAVEKCSASVKALDGALQKTGAAAAAAGVTAKYPRVAPESITDDAKKAIAPFLKAKGPGPAETAYWGKRADEKIAVADLVSACQAAADEIGATSQAFEKAAEPLRLIAVTHKMSIESQCNGLNATEAVRKDLQDCRKKAKSSECAIVCGKAKTIVDDGVPAAVFASLEKDYADICSK